MYSEVVDGREGVAPEQKKIQGREMDIASDNGMGYERPGRFLPSLDPALTDRAEWAGSWSLIATSFSLSKGIGVGKGEMGVVDRQ